MVVKRFEPLYDLVMENLQTQTPEPINTTVQQPKKSRGVVLSLTVCLGLIVATAVGVYAWQHQKVNNLNKKNASLASQLALAQKDDTSSRSSGSSISNTISYKATVGKFTLTLPSADVIVRDNDGGGEGGPFTSLGIGSKTSITGVVDYSQAVQASLVARPLHGSETFRSVVDGDLKDVGETTKTAVRVDGVDAESYTYGGFGAPQSIYFVKDGIYYKLHTEEADSPSGKLAPIIAGFKFN